MTIIPFTKSCQLGQLSRVLIVQSSADKQYSGDSFFQRTRFYLNKFTEQSPMDPNACLVYPSQLEVCSDLPPSLAYLAMLSQPMRGV
jgi:hypothetical protein